MRRKGERGAITLFVLIAGFSFITFLIAMLMAGAVKRQTQAEATKQARAIYSDGDANTIYNDYFAEGAIPIYTVAQLEKMCEVVGDPNINNELVTINEEGGKIYTFTDDAIYVLMNDLTISHTMVNGVFGLPRSATGRFEGNGKVITVNDTIEGTYYLNKDNYYVYAIYTEYQNETPVNYYGTLAEAFTGVTNGNTIKPTFSGTSKSEAAATLASGKTVTLDLNGKTITMTEKLQNEGTLEISGSGALISSTDDTVYNIGTMIKSGTSTISNSFELEEKYPIRNSGTVTIREGLISSSKWNTIVSLVGSTVNIIGGTITNTTQYPTIWTKGTLNIEGGTIDNQGTGITIQNRGSRNNYSKWRKS